MTTMKLEKSIPVTLGTIQGRIYGGPFVKYVPGTRRLVGVKMAEEIEHPSDFRVDTKDFSTPDMNDMQVGILFGIKALSDGKDVYAGCMGGIGRTGLYMACMAKVMADFATARGENLPVPADPVKYVRAHYIPHAVETTKQMDFVRNFDTSDMVAWLEAHHKKNIVYVDRVQYLSPWAWVKQCLFA